MAALYYAFRFSSSFCILVREGDWDLFMRQRSYYNVT